MLRKGRVETKAGKRPRHVAIIHCVGSRSREFHAYCSRVCCMTGLKYANEIRSAIPEAYVSDLYTDMSAFGKGCEDFYKKTAGARTVFLMYEKNHAPGDPPGRAGSGRRGMLIAMKERLSGEQIEIPADLVVLMVGMEPRHDSAAVAHLVNISRDKDGWFIESHPKLDPVATTTDGVFIAGACQSPKDIPDSVAQARAASARILAKIDRGEVAVDAVYAEVREEYCSGCRVCNELCPYAAVEYDEATRRSHVDRRRLQGVRLLRGGLPVRRHQGPPLHRRADLRADRGGALMAFEPRIVGILCNWCSYTGADLAGTSRVKYAPNVRILRVMCSARVDPTFVLKALAEGADGVLICGCHPGDCHYVEGNYKAMRRFAALKRVLRSQGIEEERVRLEWVSASEGARFAEIVNDMTEQTRKLGPSRVRPQLEADAAAR